MHSIMLTTDNCVILAQRNVHRVGKEYAGGEWSVSFEEQWDVVRDRTPYDAVLRGLSEEFNVDRNHGIDISVDNVRLLALAREWGYHWNTAMLYLVRVPADSKTVLDCWDDVPPSIDRNEHVAVAAVPLWNPSGKSFLLSLLDRSAEISNSDLFEVCGKAYVKGALVPNDKPHSLHSSSGRARALFALWASGSLDGS